MCIYLFIDHSYIHPCIHPSIHPSICSLSVFLPIHPSIVYWSSIHQFIYPYSVSIYLSVCLSVRLSILHPSIHPSIHPSVHLFELSNQKTFFPLMDPLLCTFAILELVCIFPNWFIQDPVLFQQIISGQSWLENNPKLQRNQQSSQSNTTQAVVQGLLLIFKELQDANALCKSFDFDQLCWPHQSHDSELLGDLSVTFFLVHLWFLCALGWVATCVRVCLWVSEKSNFR